MLFTIQFMYSDIHYYPGSVSRCMLCKLPLLLCKKGNRAASWKHIYNRGSLHSLAKLLI